MAWKDEVSEFKSAGFTDEEITEEEYRVRKEMSDAGFGSDEVDQYFGVVEPDLSAFKKEVSGNLAKVPANGAKPAENIFDAVEAGFQMSVTGLMARDKLPDVVLPENASMFYRIASQAATVAGDIPAMVAGGIGGYFGGAIPGTAGGAAIGSVVPGVGTLIGGAIGNVTGGVLGAGAGGNALPAMIRKYYTESLEKGEIKSFDEFWERASAVLLTGAKEGAIGAATAGVGNTVLKVASPLTSQLGAKTAQSVSEVATMTTLGAAMEGKAPSIQDFADAAVLVGGLGASAKVSAKIINTFKKTGVDPSGIALEAKSDMLLKQELLQKGDDVPSKYKQFQDVKDPNPSKPLDMEGMDPDAVELIAKPHETSTPDSPPTGVKFPPLQERTITLDNVDYFGVSEYTIRKTHNLADGDQVLYRGMRGDGSFGGWTKNRDDAIEYAKETGSGARIEVSAQSKQDANGVLPTLAEYDLKTEEIILPEQFRKKKEAAEAAMSSEEKAVNDQIVFDRKPTLKKPTFNEIYEAMVDKYDPIKVFSEMVRNGKMADPKRDPYVLARLTAGSRGRASAAIEFGAFDFNDASKVKSKGLKEILDPFREDLESFERYAVSKRAVELNSRGIESGVKLTDAEAVVSTGSKKYDKAFQELVKFQNATLEYARDSGVISKEAFDKMAEANKSYVPFHRLFDESEKSGGANIGSGLNVKNPVKSIKGSTRKIVSPLETIVRNTHVLMELAERNRAVNALVDEALSTDAGKALVSRVPPKFRATKVQGKEIEKFLAENGMDAGDIPDGLTVFRPKTSQLEKNQIVRIKDGKPEIYEVPEAVARAVKGMEAAEMSLAVKILSKPVEIFKAGITLAPEFAVKNLIRDQLGAWIQSGNGFFPYVDALSGLMSVTKKDKYWQQFLREGGGNNALVSIDRDYIKSDIFNLSKQTGLMDRAMNVVRSPIEMLKVASEMAEQATRLGEFKKGMKKGQTGPAAALSAREVTVDFARMGAKTKAINQISAFFNMGIQGQDRLIREIHKNPKQTISKLAIGITLPSVLLWAANRDDERVKDIPRWQRDLFWIVPIGDTIYRVPKPHEPGVIFGSSVERLLDAFFENDPKAGKDFAETILSGMAPNYLPTAITPALEHFANKSTFTGSAIIPKRFEGLLPELQYSEFNTESAKVLGKFIAGIPGMKESSFASPAVIDNYVRGWSGTLGVYAVSAADKLLTASGAVPDPVKPADTMADIPFVKAFVIRYPSSGTESIKNFYEEYSSSRKYQASFKYLAETLQPEAALKLRNDYASKFAKADAIFESLQNMTKVVRGVYQNKEMTRDEKRMIIDDVYAGMNLVAKQGNELMKDLSTSLKEAEKK